MKEIIYFLLSIVFLIVFFIVVDWVKEQFGIGTNNRKITYLPNSPEDLLSVEEKELLGKIQEKIRKKKNTQEWFNNLSVEEKELLDKLK